MAGGSEPGQGGQHWALPQGTPPGIWKCETEAGASSEARGLLAARLVVILPAAARAGWLVGAENSSGGCGGVEWSGRPGADRSGTDLASKETSGAAAVVPD